MPSKSPKSSSRNIKLTLEYDGSCFFGFQRQKDKPTIQAALEKALSGLFNRPMKISAAAGRTDSGVHAKAQVVNFKTDSNLPLEKIQKGLNALLPNEIAVKKLEEVPFDFHARYGAKAKTYEYLVWNSQVRSPLLNGRVYQFPYALNLTEMRRAARSLVGRRNFKAFQASGSSAKTSVRSLRRLDIGTFPNVPGLRGMGRTRYKRKCSDCLIRFVAEADGFLYHMVRNIIGTLLEVGRGNLSIKELKRALGAHQRIQLGATVPSQGLTLASVRYL